MSIYYKEGNIRSSVYMFTHLYMNCDRFSNCAQMYRMKSRYRGILVILYGTERADQAIFGNASERILYSALIFPILR